MIIGGTVKSIQETTNFVFITIEAEDRTEIRLTLRSDDPRIQQFRFRGLVAVEVNTAMAQQKVIDLIKAA